MVDSSISKYSISDLKKTVENRLMAHHRSGVEDAETDMGKKRIIEQDNILNHATSLANSLRVLLFFGYAITGSTLLLAGWQVYGFYLHPHVLIALIGSSMGATAYMFRKVAGVLLDG